MLTNTRTLRIEWGDCDPAGIVFYPRYFAMFDASTTYLIERAIGMPKFEYLKAYDFLGHPIVETRARFSASPPATATRSRSRPPSSPAAAPASRSSIG